MYTGEPVQCILIYSNDEMAVSPVPINVSLYIFADIVQISKVKKRKTLTYIGLPTDSIHSHKESIPI